MLAGHSTPQAIQGLIEQFTKTVLERALKGELTIPRDRNASFAPQIIAKQQTRWEGFDELILSLYSRGLTVREIHSHLQGRAATRSGLMNCSSASKSISIASRTRSDC
jgi:putative transposase